MEIAVQIASIFMSIIASLQKNKYLSLLFYFLDNIILTMMFFIFGRFSTACICTVAAIRTLIFFVFSIKKMKPNVFVLIALEIAFITITVVTWQDMLDLLPLFGTGISCFTSWQDNTAVMRIGYMINPIFYITYKFLIGAYISVIPEFILFFTNLISLVYYNILKKEKPILSYLKIKNKKIQTELESSNNEVKS